MRHIKAEKDSVQSASRILDLGCGAGLLGIAAVKTLSSGQAVKVCPITKLLIFFTRPLFLSSPFKDSTPHNFDLAKETREITSVGLFVFWL